MVWEGKREKGGVRKKKKRKTNFDTSYSTVLSKELAEGFFGCVLR